MKVPRKIIVPAFDHGHEQVSRVGFYSFIRLMKNSLRIADPAAFFQGKRLLDVGCGSGSDVVRFRRLGAEAVGVDAEPVVKGPYFSHGLAAALPFPAGTFDIVFVKFLIDLLDARDIGALVTESHRVLRPNGYLFINNLLSDREKRCISETERKVGFVRQTPPHLDLFIALQKPAIANQRSAVALV